MKGSWGVFLSYFVTVLRTPYGDFPFSLEIIEDDGHLDTCMLWRLPCSYSLISIPKTESAYHTERRRFGFSFYRREVGELF